MASGPIESIVLNGRRFSVDESCSPNITYPGFSNTVNVNGDGTNRLTKTRIAGKISGLSIPIDMDRGDIEFLNTVQAKMNFVAVSMTLCDKNVLSGSMQLADEISFAAGTGMVDITLNGTLEKL